MRTSQSVCTLYAGEPNSQWKNPTRPGQISAGINAQHVRRHNGGVYWTSSGPRHLGKDAVFARHASNRSKIGANPKVDADLMGNP
jgi:hypothetical protein